MDAGTPMLAGLALAACFTDIRVGEATHKDKQTVYTRRAVRRSTAVAHYYPCRYPSIAAVVLDYPLGARQSVYRYKMCSSIEGI